MASPDTLAPPPGAHSRPRSASSPGPKTSSSAPSRATGLARSRALPSFDLPTDRRVITASALAAQTLAAGAGAAHVTGVAGGAPALVVRALASQGRRKVIAVTPDLETARALAADTSFLLGVRDADDAEAAGGTTLGRVLLYLPSEASPYADVNPDRRGTQTRLATLFHVAMDLPWDVLVCPVTALARKVVPREEVMEHAELVVAEQEIDRDKLAARSPWPATSAARWSRIPAPSPSAARSSTCGRRAPRPRCASSSTAIS